MFLINMQLHSHTYVTPRGQHTPILLPVGQIVEVEMFNAPPVQFQVLNNQLVKLVNGEWVPAENGPGYVIAINRLNQIVLKHYNAN